MTWNPFRLRREVRRLRYANARFYVTLRSIEMNTGGDPWRLTPLQLVDKVEMIHERCKSVLEQVHERLSKED